MIGKGSKVWNVRATIVSLVRADTAEEAISTLTVHLDRGGWQVYDDIAYRPDAFESEPLSDA